MEAYPDEDFPDLQRAIELSLKLSEHVVQHEEPLVKITTLEIPLGQGVDHRSVEPSECGDRLVSELDFTVPTDTTTEQLTESSSDQTRKCLPFKLPPPVEGQEDVIIAIMGPCGTGKTSFINLVMGDVGYGLQFGKGAMTQDSRFHFSCLLG
jgi:hypothetical protein